MPNIDKNSGIIYENTVKRNTAGMSQYDQLVKAGEVIPYHLSLIHIFYRKLNGFMMNTAFISLIY